MKKEKAKEFAKKYLIGFILGVVSACTVSVIAVTYFPSNDVTYDNSESGLTSTNVQGAIDELYGVCTAEPPAGDQIIEDAGLEKDPYECRYFFTGANPNNYITFNDEEAGWRIVSVECDGTIKIMRTATAGNRAWDTSGDYGSNNWVRPATLNTYLNSTYYNGLNSTAKNKIVTKDWGIGGVTDENNDLEKQVTDENSKKWQGKLALPTLSEYLRTNSNKSECGTFYLNNINDTICQSTNWMYRDGEYWWTLSSRIDLTSRVFIIGNGANYGHIYNIDAKLSGGYNSYPTLYLSSDIKITGGDGSQSNPYQLG